MFQGSSTSPTFAVDGNGDITLAKGPQVLSGVADPESGVTAPVGSVYLRTNGVIYKKNSGTGNTGWEAFGQWDGHTALSDTAYDDIVVAANAITVLGGTNIPTTAWLTNLRVLEFGASGGDYGYFDLQLPHSYVAGTDILWHVHFTNPSTIADGETVIFPLVFSSSAIGDGFGATQTVSATFTNDAAARADIDPGQLSGTTIAVNTHLIASGGTVSGTGLGLSSLVYCRIERSAADTHAGDAYVLSADAHIQKNRIGSENEYTD